MKVVLFTLSTFKPCKNIVKILSELGVPFKEIVVDYNKATEVVADLYEVNTVPTIVILEGKKVIDRITGYQIKSFLEEKLKQYK